MMIFGREPTEEEMAQMQREHDEARMKNEAFNNEVQQWIESLTGRETFLFKAILIATVNDDLYTSRQIGEANGRMKYKHNVDPESGLPEGMDFFADSSIAKDEEKPDGDGV